MTPDHVRGRLSSDAGMTSSSIISPTIPSPISTLSTAPFMMLSPASTTSDNLIHRRFPYGLLSSRTQDIDQAEPGTLARHTGRIARDMPHSMNDDLVFGRLVENQI